MTIEITDELVNKLVRNAHLGLITAARRAGVSPKTLQRWLKRSEPQYQSLARAYYAAMADDAEVLIADAKEKDPIKMLSILHGIREPKEHKQSGLTVNAPGGNVLVLAREIAAKRLPAEEIRRQLAQGEDDGNEPGND